MAMQGNSSSGGGGGGGGGGIEGWSARDDDRRINVYMTCGQPLVWTPEEQEILRRRYNIVCHPIGTLPNHSSQNIFKGVPYMIDDEAVRLLLEFDKVQLWHGDDLAPFLPSDIASLQRHRLDSIILQLDHMLYGQQGREPKLHDPPRTKRAKRGSDDPAQHADTPDRHSPDDGASEDVQESGEDEEEAGAWEGREEGDVARTIKETQEMEHEQSQGSGSVGDSSSGPIASSASAARTVVSWVLNRVDVERWLKFPWTRRGKALAARDMDTVKALDPDKEQPTQEDLVKGGSPTSSASGADAAGLSARAGGGDGDGHSSTRASRRSSANRERLAEKQIETRQGAIDAKDGVGEEQAEEEEPPQPRLVWCNMRRDIGQRLGACRVVVPHQAPGIRHRRRPFLARSFKFPATKEEKQRYAVYRDLVLRGYFLTPGLKFGGHYLAYPGDPYRYHSHFVVVVVDHHQPLHPLDFVAAGRLGTVVKKAPLLCSVDENGGVHYVSLQWTGIN